MKHHWLVAFVLIANLAVIGGALAMLRSGLWRARFSKAVRARTLASCAVVLLAWYASISAIGLRGAFATTVANVPLLPFGIAVPFGVGLWMFLRSERLKAVARAVPLWWLVAIQAYRVIGVAFLFVFLRGEMPAEAALPAGVGDILVGVLAVPAAMSIRNGARGARRAVWLWNYLGIVDFAVAIATGYLTSPGPFQLLAREHPNLRCRSIRW